MTNSKCPVVHGFLACALPLLPHSTEEAALWSAAVDCYGHAMPAEVESARAHHVVEFVVKICLPRAFDMFRLPNGRDVLTALPPLNADTISNMDTALQQLSHQKWDSGFCGEALLRESVLRPLAVAQEALALLAAGQHAEVCATLEPVIERLSATEELTPTLATLLRITPSYPNGQPTFTPSAPMGLSFGTAG